LCTVSLHSCHEKQITGPLPFEYLIVHSHFQRYSPPVTYDAAVDLCSGDDSGCSFPDPPAAIEFYMACVAAGILIPNEVFRVDAKVTVAQPGVWITSTGEVTTEDTEPFASATCEVGSGPNEAEEMTCGVNFFLREFTCLGVEDPVPALLGAPSIPAPTTTLTTTTSATTTTAVSSPTGSCPDDGGEWLYIDDTLCVQ
jgi:hypothetical protein